MDEEEEFASWIELSPHETIRFGDLAGLIGAALHGETFAAAAAEINLEDELPKLVRAGVLTPRDPLTNGPHPFPHGDALKNARLRPDAQLRAFLADRGIGLRILPTDALEASSHGRGGAIDEEAAKAEADCIEAALQKLAAEKLAKEFVAATPQPEWQRLKEARRKEWALPFVERLKLLRLTGRDDEAAALEIAASRPIDPDKPQRSKAPEPVESASGGGAFAPRERPQGRRDISWPLWLKPPRVALWEAVALVLALDPKSLKPSSNGWMAGPNRGPFFEPRSFPSEAKWEAFEEALSFAKRSATEGGSISVQPGFPTTHTGFAEVSLREVVAFFVSVDWQGIPEELMTLASSPRPEKAEGAPVLETSGKDNWRNLAKDYMVQKLRAGRYSTAKELDAALRACVNEPDTPFEAGTGDNRGHLVLRKTGKKLDLKTIQNNWQELRNSAGQR